MRVALLRFRQSIPQATFSLLTQTACHLPLSSFWMAKTRSLSKGQTNSL